MRQIREEVCSWVALAIWQGLAEEGEERMVGVRRGRKRRLVLDFAIFTEHS